MQTTLETVVIPMRTFDSLPCESKVVIFDALMKSRQVKTADLLSLSLISRSTHEGFMTFIKGLPETRQQGVRDLAMALFKSRYKQYGTLYFKLLEIAGAPLDSLNFLMEIPPETQKKMINREQFVLPYLYPSDVPFEDLKSKLHIDVLTHIWLSVLDSPEVHAHCFSDPEETDYMKSLCASKDVDLDAAHLHLRKLTDYMMRIHKDSLNVSDKLLRSLCYWQLYTSLMDIGQFARMYKTHLNNVLPWVLLLVSNHRHVTLAKLSDKFQVSHFAYLHANMPKNDFIEMAQFWYKVPTFQSYIRQIPIDENYEFLMHLKTNGFVIME